MRISEAVERTGLSVSNIRFYKKKGLLEPIRDQQSKYRDYSEGDIYRLKKIMLFRKIDIPIEKIYLILNKESDIEPILEQQMLVLKEQQEKLQGFIDLCGEVLAKYLSEQFDIDYYLDYVKKEEASGRKFAEIEDLMEDIVSYTKFDMLMADPVIARLFMKPGSIRIVRMFWAAAMVLLPAIVIIDGCMDTEGVSLVRAVYWTSIFLFWWGSFICFRRKSQK